MSQITIENLIDEFAIYLEVHRNYAKGTIENYHHDVNRLANWLKEKRNVVYFDDCTMPDITAFLGTLRHEDGSIYAPRTLNRVISAIRSFNRWGVKQNYIKKDLSSSLESPKLEKGPPKSLSLEESALLIATARERKLGERDGFMVGILLRLGIRLAELCRIDLDHINESSGLITIHGKGNKIRHLTVTPAIIRELHTYLPIRMEILKKRNNVDEKALFVSEWGRRLNRRSVELIVEEISKKAGISLSFNVTPHKLRHTCATILYNEGDADILAISEILGHASPNTSKIYTEVKREKMRSVVLSNPLESV